MATNCKSSKFPKGIKIRDVITDGEVILEITGLSSNVMSDSHVFAGGRWIPDMEFKNHFVKIKDNEKKEWVNDF